MDKLSEHAIKMLEIVDNERGFYHDYDREIADIARAVYDLILQVQMLKIADRKTESSGSGKPNNWAIEAHKSNAIQRTQRVESVESVENETKG